LAAPKTITLNGKRWRLEFRSLKGKNDALCDPPTTPRKAIVIHRPTMKTPKRFMELLLHEGLHAQCWPLDEEFVRQAAEDLARLLWVMGFRRVSDQEEAT
jgi:hypothetical protein